MNNDYSFTLKGYDKTSPAFTSINNNLIKMDKNVLKAGKSMSIFGAQKGSMQQLGYQVQDVAVQLQMGTSALVVFGQQGSQILSLFGPGGAMIGALLAVGAALGTAFLPAIFASKDATEELSKAMEKLREIASKGDEGIYEFTEAIRELSKLGSTVVGAELEASLIRAEQAAKAAAKGITEELNKLDVDYGFSGIKTIVDALNNVNKSTNVNVKGSEAWLEITSELGEQFGKTGDKARSFGGEIISAIAELQNTPTPEKFKDLQQQLSAAALSGDKVSEKAKLMVSDLKLFFAEARASGETASFLREQLEKLGEVGSVDFGGPDGLSDIEQKAIALGQQLAIAQANLSGSKLEAEQLAIAFDLNLEATSQLPENIKSLVEQLFKVKDQQRANHDDLMAQLEDEKRARSQVEAEERILSSLKSQILLLSEGKQAQEEFNIAQQLGLEVGQKIPESIQLQIDKLNELRDAKLLHNDSLTDMERTRIEEEKKMHTQNFLFDLQSIGARSKKLYGIAKAASIAQAVMNTYAAANQALAAPYPWPIPQVFAGVAVAAGLANVAAIKNQQIPSFEGGGYIPNGPRSGGLDGRGGQLAMVHPNESIIDHNLGGSSQGSPISITFAPVIHSSSPDDWMIAAKKSQKQLMRMVQSAINKPI